MTKEELLNKTRLFLFDLDGTLYRDATPIGDAVNSLKKLRAAGKRLCFLTNNSSKTEEQYRAKLKRIGFWEEGDSVYTSGMAAISYLLAHYPEKRVYLLGTAALKEEFACAGVHIVETDPEVCVLAYDTELTFAKIRAFHEFLTQGAVFLATHPDEVCPTAGISMPDVGSFLALFDCSSGRRPSVITGKPFSVMGEALVERTGVPRDKICMVGDRLHTDIRFARNNGMMSVLVLTGETTRWNMGKYPDKPDLILSGVDELASDV